MNFHNRQHRCFVALLLSVAPCLKAQDDQQTLRSVFEKAKNLSDIKAKGMPGSSTGDLLEVSSGHNTTDIAWKVDWQEHSKFQEWSAKRLPLLLRGHNGKQTVLEVNFEEIKPLPPLPSNFFAPLPEATRWAACDHGAVWTLKERVQPQYPASARMQHRQGTVLLYAVIGEDGKLSGLKIAHSAGQELDQSALSAVSHWRYERTATCSESKGRTETFIDVVYALQN